MHARHTHYNVGNNNINIRNNVVNLFGNSLLHLYKCQREKKKKKSIEI